MTDRTFRVQSGHWHGNDGSRGMSLEIQDEISGVVMARLRLTPEQAYDLTRGSTFSVEGEHGSRLDWVGKFMVHESHAVPREVLKDVHYSEMADVGRAWAKANLPGWDTYEARRNNSGGVNVVVRSWHALDVTPEVSRPMPEATKLKEALESMLSAPRHSRQCVEVDGLYVTRFTFGVVNVDRRDGEPARAADARAVQDAFEELGYVEVESWQPRQGVNWLSTGLPCGISFRVQKR